MQYTEVFEATERAWDEFYHSLSQSGLSNDQIEAFIRKLDANDVYNAVVDCAVEVCQ